MELGGVSGWALTAARSMARRGIAVSIVARAGADAPGMVPGDGVELVRWDTIRAPVIEHEIDAMVRAIGDAAEAIGDPDRLVICPHLSGSAYAAAAVAAEQDNRRRVAGWLHSVMPHDLALLARLEACLGAIACVSSATALALDRWITRPGPPVRVIQTGVQDPLGREPEVRPASDPVRLIYAGRMDRDHKRVMSLIPMMERLADWGVNAELLVVGSGEASEPFDTGSAGRAGIERIDAVPPGELAALYGLHDLFVLPSRSEGLGLARIEAALCACVPLVAGSAGGAVDGIEDGVSGVIARVGRDDDDETAGAGFARAAMGALESGIGAMRVGARRAALAMCSMERFDAALGSFVELAAGSEPRGRALAEVARDPVRVAAFSVPPDAARRAAEVLASMGGARVAIYGVGAHTRAIMPEIRRAVEEAWIRLVAYLDDDPAAQGGAIGGVPIVGPDGIGSVGAEFVVVSSWLHQGSMARRIAARIERLGLAGEVRVRTLYPSEGARDGAPTPA